MKRLNQTELIVQYFLKSTTYKTHFMYSKFKKSSRAEDFVIKNWKALMLDSFQTNLFFHNE